MKFAAATTTIHVPSVLKLYQAHRSSIDVYIAGDKRTPAAAKELSEEQGWHYLSVEDQGGRYPLLSDAIGWSTIGRRNIAILEALKSRPEIIVLVDDDNLPLSSAYFFQFAQALSYPFNGMQVWGTHHWFDVGQLLDPVAPHRGFPMEVNNAYEVEATTNAQVGVAAGICLGDPDISAITRIADRPMVHRASALLDAGVVVAPKTYTVFNSQNTAFLSFLAPAFLMLPQLQRYDDIFASYVAQLVMQRLDLQVHFGKPFVWQQRNQHNLISDLRNEAWGYENFWRLTEKLRDINLVDDESLPIPQRVIGLTRQIYTAADPYMPAGVLQLASLWLAEMEKIYAPQERQVPQGGEREHQRDAALGVSAAAGRGSCIIPVT